MRPFKGLMMTKFEHIAKIAGERIVSSFDMDINGTPAKVWIMMHDDAEIMVATPLNPDDPEVMIININSPGVRLNGHYEGVFECLCVLDGILEKIASGECDCPECAKEKQAATIH